MGKRPPNPSDIENGLPPLPPPARPPFRPPIPVPWYAWLVPLIFAANFVTFTITMYVNDCPARSDECLLFDVLGRLSFQPIKENMLLGPSIPTLRRLGALERRLVEEGERWRLISCIWLHGGLLHLLANMISLLCIGMRLEQEFGFLRIGALYVLSGLGGSLMSCLTDSRGERVSVGASGALFGLLGAMLSELITNWTIYENKNSRDERGRRAPGEHRGKGIPDGGRARGGRCTALMTLILIIALNLSVGFLPRVDNSAHCGGFLAGFLLGFVLLLRPQYGYVSPEYIPPGYDMKHKKSKYKCYQHFFRFTSLAILLAGFIAGYAKLLREHTVGSEPFRDVN
uniref:RHOMBOID-like protein n=1 Tax=Brassica oleracea var. oleracea TaxID=109376 RepID=A0A0D3CRB3_BRAOL